MSSAQTSKDPVRTAQLRCTFIHAPDPGYSVTQNYGARFLPVWIYRLAAHVPGDGRFLLRMADLQYEPLEGIEEADVFLFSGINQDLQTLLQVRTELQKRYPRAKTVLGGPIAWSFDQAGCLADLSAFDHVCIGDGEDQIGGLLEDLHEGRPVAALLRARERFNLSRSRPMHRGLLEATLGKYYGAVVEVSRGCPFLCEFCDIRVLADNNRAHNMPPSLVVEELDYLARKKVHQVIFACDNFIGDAAWAEELIDRILEWQERLGFRINIYTWATINLYKFPALMSKMRKAGFDLLFIGIESFNANSLLETAKVQNSAQELTEAVRHIQSYGFIIVAGLIFGFDSDEEDFPEVTLEGIRSSGLISGDPNWLTALPGTPLHRRMKLSGRLRELVSTHGGVKYQTNIRYLLPRRKMIDGFRRFIRIYLDGSYQYSRLKTFFESLKRGNFIPIHGNGFGNLGLFLMQSLGSRRAIAQLARRIGFFLANPMNVAYALKALALTAFQGPRRGAFGYFQFWVFAWTNAMFKYKGARDEDFDIESVDSQFKLKDLLPEGYAETAMEQIPRQKIADQLRVTTAQLRKTIDRRSPMLATEAGSNFASPGAQK
jgi:radical SAM superfamily enzyme YgiQ (UPF0313 family)